ncbi:MAG: hypothetical protein HC822_16770 [Oscillochloris sp.]|nr:hypothetical protein [Oscillochloris sp.]
MLNLYTQEYDAHQRLKQRLDDAQGDRLAAQFHRRYSWSARLLAWLGSVLERSGAALRRRYAGQDYDERLARIA